MRQGRSAELDHRLFTDHYKGLFYPWMVYGPSGPRVHSFRMDENHRIQHFGFYQISTRHFGYVDKILIIIFFPGEIESSYSRSKRTGIGSFSIHTAGFDCGRVARYSLQPKSTGWCGNSSAHQGSCQFAHELRHQQGNGTVAFLG